MKKLYLAFTAAILIMIANPVKSFAQCTLTFELTCSNNGAYYGWNRSPYYSMSIDVVHGTTDNVTMPAYSGTYTTTVSVNSGESFNLNFKSSGSMVSDFLSCASFRVLLDGVEIVPVRTASGLANGASIYVGSCAASCANTCETPDVTATPGNGLITLSWPAVTGATGGYEITCNGNTYTTTNTSYTISGLTNGTTYTYTVKALGDGTNYCSSGAATGSATPTDPSACSALTLTLTDSYGDGWNGASLNVSINGGTATSYTGSGASVIHTISVNRGDEVVITWTGGYYDYECSFTISGGDGVSVTATTANCSAYAEGEEIYSGTPCEEINLCAILSIPTVTATPGTGKISLSWPTVTNADEYEITCNGNTYTTTSTSYEVTGLTNGTSYTYTVKAIGDGTDYCDSDDATGSAIPCNPLQALNLSIDESVFGQVTFTWDADPNATYSLLCNGVTKTTSPAVITGLTDGVDYNYTLTITPGAGSCDNIADVSGKAGPDCASQLATPTNVNVQTGNNSVILTWDAVPNATSYRVSIDDVTFQTVGNNLSKSYFDLPNGYTCNYRIIASATGYCESSAATGSFTPNCTGNLATPTNVTATARINGAKISWDPVEGASNYLVFYGNPVVSTYSSTSPCILSGMTGGQNYTVYVQAISPAGSQSCSSADASVSVTPNSPASCPVSIKLYRLVNTSNYWSNNMSPSHMYVSIDGGAEHKYPESNASGYLELGLTNNVNFTGTHKDYSFNITPGQTISIRVEDGAGNGASGYIIDLPDGTQIKGNTTSGCTVTPPAGSAYIVTSSNIYTGSPCKTSIPDCITSGIVPSSGTTGTALKPTLSWNDSDQADSYTVCYGTTPGNLTDTIKNIVNNEVKLPSLSPNTTYYWAVYPVNTGGMATGCSTYNFTTGTGAVLCEGNPFNAGTLGALSATASKTTGIKTTNNNSFPGSQTVKYCIDDHAYYGGVDSVFTFTAPVAGKVTVTATITTSPVHPFSYSIYDACPLTSSNPNCVASASSDGVSKVLRGCVFVEPNVTYYFVIDSYTGTASMKFMALFSKIAAATANDEPCGAQGIPVATSFDNISYATFTTDCYSETTTPPAPTCGNFNGSDAWFVAAVPESGAIGVICDDNVILDGAFAIYNGTDCNNMTLLSCNSSGSIDAPSMPQAEFEGLTPGSRLYIRFWDEQGDNNSTFNIAAYEPDVPPACTSNDPAADAAVDATFICNFNGYCGNTSADYTAGDEIADYAKNFVVNGSTTPCEIAINNGDYRWGHITNHNCYGSIGYSIENDSWLRFTAAETEVTLKLYVSNCQNGDGIQFQVFHVDEGGRWSWGYIDQFYSPQAVEDYEFVISNLVIGEEYLIQIDGFDGDVCDYVMRAVDGLAFADAGEDQIIDAGASTTITPDGDILSYQWAAVPADPGLAGQENASTLNVSPAQTTTYYLTATSGNAGCPSTILDSITVYVNEVLPVEWLYRKANCEDNVMTISWATASEQNCSHFIVEKSYDGLNFSTMAVVTGNGTTSSIHTYSCKDENAGNFCYYRIIQVDNDGKTEITNVFFGACTDADSQEFFNAHVNGNNIDVVFDTDVNVTYTVSLLDASGKLLHNEMYKSEVAENTVVSFAKTKYAAGVYFVRVSSSKGAQSQKIVLQ